MLMIGGISIDVSKMVEGSGCLYEKGDARCSRGEVDRWVGTRATTSALVVRHQSQLDPDAHDV